VVDVFEQVEEELRSERYKRLARTWLPVVGGILLVALLAALVWWGLQSRETAQAGTASVSYQRGLTALEAGDLATAQTAFTEAADEGNGAYRSLALQQQAGLAVQRNQIPQAVELFDQAADAKGDPLLADSARLKAAMLLMDTAPLAEVEERLTPLAEEGRPLRPFAQEALAMARLQHGQFAPAREIFVQLQLGQDVPDTIRQKAQAGIAAIDSGNAANLARIVAAQAQAQPAATPAPAPAADAATAPAAPAQPTAQ